jgi:hypothetical protein
MWAFYFFTVVSLADVIGTGSRLVRYSFLNNCFHRAYK